RTRTAPIVLDDIQGGGGIPITLDTHTYSATGLTDENFTMDEVELTNEVLKPQSEAVARDLETDVVTQYNGLLTRETVTFTENAANSEISDPYKVAINAGMKLDRQKRVPQAGRVWLVGANVAAAILKHDRFSKFDWAGPLNATALREATIARVANFDVVTSPEFDPNFSIFTHRSSLVLGTVAPKAPRGATFSASARADGFALRWLMDYDSNFLRDRSIVSMFSGITPVYDEIFLTGTKKGELKVATDYTNVDAATSPASARAVKVNFTPAA
ncbi:MAG: hypothetical protein M3524_09715, partial [Actinomycetota bacterium]|nr:hypothetical protein [Actinomycetota bacterium]